MKTNIIILVLLLVTITYSKKNEIPDSSLNYFPSEVGNTWQYLHYYYYFDPAFGSTTYYYSIEEKYVIKDTLFQGINYYQHFGFPNNGFYRLGEENMLYKFNQNINQEVLIMDFNLSSGMSFLSSGYNATVEEGYRVLLGHNQDYKGFSYKDVNNIRHRYQFTNMIGISFYETGYSGSMGIYRNDYLLIQAKLLVGDSIIYLKENYIPDVVIDSIYKTSDSTLMFTATISHPLDRPGSSNYKNMFYSDSAYINYFFSNGFDSTLVKSANLTQRQYSNIYDVSLPIPCGSTSSISLFYQFKIKDKGIDPEFYLYPENNFTSYLLMPLDVKNNNHENFSFQLHQNYPNPFNPTTKIRYSIPSVETHSGASTQNVLLKVYDVLGNEIATLVNEEKPPGEYEVEFDAAGISSGIYFYRLTAGSFIQTKKMILLR